MLFRSVREALAEEDRAIREERRRSGPSASERGSRNATGSTAAAAAASGTAVPSVEDLPGLTPLERHRAQVEKRAEGGPAPFDTEAT